MSGPLVIQLFCLAIVVLCVSWQVRSLKRIRAANAKISADYVQAMTLTDPFAQLSPYTNLSAQQQLQNANLANLYAGLSNANAYAQMSQVNSMAALAGVTGPLFMHDVPGTPLQLERIETAEVIVAWRAWTWTDVGSRIILRSLNAKTLWLWAEPASADKLTADTLTVDGIHAFKTEAQAKSYAANTVWGEVSLWGRVIEHDLGYRAEFAYPRTIVVPATMPNAAAIAKKLARAYGIEVCLEDGLRR